ncbi:MAG: carbohydrate kinase [Alicyclobacillus sp.]|nr:carbohydrate kinase [Alicyclobacillus sp.]
MEQTPSGHLSTFPLLVCLGELLADLVPETTKDHDILPRSYHAHLGGAPANVAAAAAHFGLPSALFANVGSDPLGQALIQTLAHMGVDTRGVRVDPHHPTPITLVSLSPQGERSFTFYRFDTADAHLQPDSLDLPLLSQARCLHVGSVSLSRNPARSATLAAVHTARAHGLSVSFDPNLRLALWPDETTARQAIETLLPLAHLVKVSLEELAWLTGLPLAEAVPSHTTPPPDNLFIQAETLRRHWQIPLLLVTLGHRGCTWHSARGAGWIPGFSVATVDTTGAGDVFVASVLSQWLLSSAAAANPSSPATDSTQQDVLALPAPPEQTAPPRRDAASDLPASCVKQAYPLDLSAWPVHQLECLLATANAAAALSTTRHGAVSALPAWPDVCALAQANRIHPADPRPR